MAIGSDQQQQQVAQQQQAAQHDNLRDLAAEINKPAPLSDSALSLRKGVVTAVNYTGVPTVSLTLSGDTTTVVSGVRFWDSISPVVGQTVVVGKQGADLIVVGHVAEDASTWTKPTLNGSWSHNGNAQGDLMYRKVFDHGVWKMQWQGAVGTGSPGSDILTLPGGTTGFRPASKRKVLGPRDHDSGLTAVIIVFETDGTVHLEGDNYTLASGSHTHGLGQSGAAGDTHDHSHNGAVSETSFSETHTHALGTSGSAGSNVTIPYPNWVSFNYIEYFL